VALVVLGLLAAACLCSSAGTCGTLARVVAAVLEALAVALVVALALLALLLGTGWAAAKMAGWVGAAVKKGWRHARLAGWARGWRQRGSRRPAAVGIDAVRLQHGRQLWDFA
jgi:hypothetical protein